MHPATDNNYQPHTSRQTFPSTTREPEGGSPVDRGGSDVESAGVLGADHLHQPGHQPHPHLGTCHTSRKYCTRKRNSIDGITAALLLKIKPRFTVYRLKQRNCCCQLSLCPCLHVYVYMSPCLCLHVSMPMSM